MQMAGQPILIALNDYMFVFDIHTFMEYFMEKYNGEITDEVIEDYLKEEQQTWNKHANEILVPLLKVQAEARKNLYDQNLGTQEEEEAEEKKETEDTGRMYS